MGHAEASPATWAAHTPTNARTGTRGLPACRRGGAKARRRGARAALAGSSPSSAAPGDGGRAGTTAPIHRHLGIAQGNDKNCQ